MKYLNLAISGYTLSPTIVPGGGYYITPYSPIIEISTQQPRSKRASPRSVGPGREALFPPQILGGTQPIIHQAGTGGRGLNGDKYGKAASAVPCTQWGCEDSGTAGSAGFFLQRLRGPELGAPPPPGSSSASVRPARRRFVRGRAGGRAGRVPGAPRRARAAVGLRGGGRGGSAREPARPPRPASRSRSARFPRPAAALPASASYLQRRRGGRGSRGVARRRERGGLGGSGGLGGRQGRGLQAPGGRAPPAGQAPPRAPRPQSPALPPPPRGPPPPPPTAPVGAAEGGSAAPRSAPTPATPGAAAPLRCPPWPGSCGRGPSPPTTKECIFLRRGCGSHPHELARAS